MKLVKANLLKTPHSHSRAIILGAWFFEKNNGFAEAQAMGI